MDRPQAELSMTRRAGRLMRAIGLDSITVDGTNTDLADPIGVALRALGLSTVDPTDPTSAECAAVSASDTDEFLDRCELRLLNNILSNWDRPNERAGIDMQEWGRLSDSLQARVKALTGKVKDEYGDSAVTHSTEAGVVDLDFQALTTDTYL